MRRDKPLIALLVTAVAVGGLGLGGYSLLDAQKDALSSSMTKQLVPDKSKAEPETPTAVVVSGKKAPAHNFMNAMDAYAPEGTSPKVKSTGTSSTPVDWVCSNLKFTPPPIMGSQVTLDDSTVIVQAFGAGQANKALSDFQRGVSACANNDGNAYITTTQTLVPDATGFSFVSRTGNKITYASVWSQGDVMVSVYSPSALAARSLLESYSPKVNKELVATQCLSLATSQADPQRSPFYNPGSYVGWEKGRKVTLSASAAGVGLGFRTINQEHTGQGRLVGELPGATQPSDGTPTPASPPMIPSKPLAPLPEGMSDSLPPQVSEPAPFSLSKPEAAPMKATIKERVEDLHGPGCGWAWSGQLPPNFDASSEKERADTEEKKTKETLRNQYIAYLSDYSAWHNKFITYTIAVSQWNDYVSQASIIAQEWDALNSIRNDYRAALDKYWEDFNNRETFIEDQKKAHEKYQDDTKACIADAEATAQKEQDDIGNSDNTDSPDPIPSVTSGEDERETQDPEPEPTQTETQSPQEQCELPHPTILDQDVPPVPSAPQVPNVPLPDSWTDIP